MSNNTITFQVYSDLHLELLTRVPKITPLAPYLFLAGDISQITHPSFKDFFTYCSQNWSKVFYVLGNHEFYSSKSHINKIKERTKQFFINNKLNNIFLLDNEITKISDDIIVIGTTFWTRSPFSSQEDAQESLNDYNHIKYFDATTMKYPNKITPDIINNLSEADVTFLIQTLNGHKDKKIIVFTHFPPQTTDTSHSKYKDNGLLNNYFSWPDYTLKVLNTKNVLCWISGHTHYSYDFVNPDGIRLISNQMGYIDEAKTNECNFNENGTYTINY